MRLLKPEGEENSTGAAAADTTVPPVGEPKAGDPEPVQAPPPNPADRIQEQAERAVAANAQPEQMAVNTVHEAATALMDAQEVVAAMRRSLIEFESALALGTHEIAHEARAFLAHCAEKLKRHIPS